MKIKVKNTGSIIPKNLTQYDVGYDIVASSHPAISGEFNEETQMWSRIDYIPVSYTHLTLPTILLV